MDNTEQPQRIISFCTGIRGIERGLERAGVVLQPVCYVEIEAFLIANLVAAMEARVLAPAPIWTDCTTFDAEPFRGRVHGIIGGYPCTPFSLAGKRRGEEDPRHLWPSIRRHVASIRPVWCFFENVDDHLTMGFDTVYKDLRALGYAVEAGVFSAEEVGAPHERQRLFILAISEDYRGAGNPARKSLHASELADGISEGFQKRKGNRHHDDEEQPTVERSCHKLADTDICRQQQRKPSGMGREREQISWPARYGQPQHEWEHPRTINRKAERILGLAINGYNFRTDLLRAAGNSVVEQQAEFAYKTLINKFYGDKVQDHY